MTFSYYYADPDGNRVELQVDNFGDRAKSGEWMRSSLQFKEDPLGKLVDPERVAVDRAKGTRVGDGPPLCARDGGRGTATDALKMQTAQFHAKIADVPHDSIADGVSRVLPLAATTRCLRQRGGGRIYLAADENGKEGERS